MTTHPTPTAAAPVLRFDPRADGIARWLPPLEAAIMTVLWDAGRPLTIKLVHRRMERAGTERAYTTIGTTMLRLVARGLLCRTVQGRPREYRTTETRAEFEIRQAQAIVKSLRGGTR